MLYRNFEERFPNLTAGLLNAYRNEHLGGAYLLYGDDPTWREAGAMYLAAMTVCADPLEGARPCGKCRNCRQISEHTYAEMFELSPSGKAGYIRIGDESAPEANTLRWFVQQFELASSGINGRKIGIIHNCDAMNSEAQNAFLKTLEEPDPGVIFILLTGNPGALLATTRSRCQLLPLLTNTLQYDFAGAAELCGLLNRLIFEAQGNIVLASGIADEMLELTGKLSEDSSQRADKAWEKRLEQASNTEDKSLYKRIAEQRDNAGASFYLMLRKQFLSLLHSYCAQVWIWSQTGTLDGLNNRELLEQQPLPEKPDPAVARRALAEADKLLYRLRFQVDEKLAIRSFAVNIACGGDIPD
ncbi:MAG: hypothetical protein E7052_01770 [Lentisphaerae bacterium]|nr:hypothetical protein [Lentisphaerota bacterium]